MGRRGRRVGRSLVAGRDLSDDDVLAGSRQPSDGARTRELGVVRVGNDDQIAIKAIPVLRLVGIEAAYSFYQRSASLLETVAEYCATDRLAPWRNDTESRA